MYSMKEGKIKVKVLSISAGLLIVLFAFSICIDIFMGDTFLNAINNALNSFSVMDPIEILILSFFTLLLFIKTFASYYRNMQRKRASKSNK